MGKLLVRPFPLDAGLPFEQLAVLKANYEAQAGEGTFLHEYVSDNHGPFMTNLILHYGDRIVTDFIQETVLNKKEGVA